MFVSSESPLMHQNNESGNYRSILVGWFVCHEPSHNYRQTPNSTEYSYTGINVFCHLPFFLCPLCRQDSAHLATWNWKVVKPLRMDFYRPMSSIYWINNNRCDRKAIIYFTRFISYLSADLIFAFFCIVWLYTGAFYEVFN